MAGVPRTPMRLPSGQWASTGVAPHFGLGTSPPSLAAVNAVLWSGAHQTPSAFVHDSVSGPVRGDLVDLAMKLPAVAAVDVRENRDDVLDLPVLRPEHDHAFRVYALEHGHARLRTGSLGNVDARVGVVDVASNDVAAVARHVRDVGADRDLIHALERRVADVGRFDTVELARELFLAEGLVVGQGRGEHEAQQRQRNPCLPSHGGLLLGVEARGAARTWSRFYQYCPVLEGPGPSPADGGGCAALSCARARRAYRFASWR